MKIYSVPENDSFKAKAAAWIKNRIVDAKDIWENNKKEIMILIPIAIGGVVKATKSINKTINLHQEEKLKDRRMYDPKMGHYWELNRKLDNNEWVEIEMRKEKGEPVGNILRSMGVLK